MKLERLKKVALREIWLHEALDFTNWLAEEDNLSLLSDEIGIEIKLLQTEASVGKFNVDILAEEENTGRQIIIENQLETTNHDHLGKIITYASGLDAEIVVWIVRDVRDEHKQAIDWLNEHTDQKINFFIIKMELWQIGNSAVAPKFQIISKPNDWAKAVKKASQQNQLSEMKLLQLEFWEGFKQYAEGNSPKVKLQKPQPQHWYTIAVGSSEAHIGLTVNSRDCLIACELYIRDSKSIFYSLEGHKDQIESEIGDKLKWMVLEGKRASRIVLVREGDITKTDQWDSYFEWLKIKAEIFHKVFGKYLKKINKK